MTRFWAVFVKACREQARDLLVLVLTLSFAPMFVLLYYAWIPSGSTTYGVLVLDQDRGVMDAGSPDGATIRYSPAVAEALTHVTYADGKPMLVVREATDRASAETALRDRKATVLVTLPPDFSARIGAMRAGDAAVSAPIVLSGDLSNPYYAVAAVFASSAIDAFVQDSTGRTPTLAVSEEPLGGSAARTEFEAYVPGLLVMGAVLLVFSASMAVTREVEAGTLSRLVLTRMTAFDLLGGISLSQAVLGVLAVLLTFATAVALGFRSVGPLWVAVLVGAITSLAVIGIGMVVACFSRTVAQAFVIANFPLAALMFFSGAIYPVPRATLVTIAGRGVAINDLLPPTHAVVALNKVLSLGAGLGDVLFEITALTLLTALYLAIGMWAFHRRFLRT